jgi:hypothetical protein
MAIWSSMITGQGRSKSSISTGPSMPRLYDWVQMPLSSGRSGIYVDMKSSDLAEYLDHDPFLEHSEPRQKDPRKADVKSDLMPATPVTPEKPKRSAAFERDKHESDVLHMVMEIFPGARWTTREEYKRAIAYRDRKGRRTRE